MSGRVRRLLVAAWGFLCASACVAATDFASWHASADARYAVNHVLGSADHHGRPFAIVDKKAARIYVFSAAGRLVGASPALLGASYGDRLITDTALRIPNRLGADEKTTPSGRFDSVPGHNDKGEAIVWIDYDASLAIHRLRPAPPHERRAARLASPSADDNRISSGCVVVPEAFYDAVVAPVLGRARGVVYVLPESRPVQALFDAAGL